MITLYEIMGTPVSGAIENTLPLHQHLNSLGYRNIICDVKAPYSPWNARCQDKDGIWWYVKVIGSSPDHSYKHGEYQALKHLSKAGISPEAKQLTSCGLFLAVKAISGKPINEMQEGNETSAPQLIEVGHIMRKVHQLEIPSRTGRFYDILPLRYFPTPTGVRLPTIAQGYWITSKLYEHFPDEREVYLHGDCSPGNILEESGRIWLIDPYGVKGPAVFDLMRLASYYRNPVQALKYLEQGYGISFDMNKYSLVMAWSCMLVRNELTPIGKWTSMHQELVENHLPNEYLTQ